MGAVAGDVMLLTPLALRPWGWGFVGVWIFSGLYWTGFFSPAIYVLSLKFRLSQEYEDAAFKTGFRAEPDKPDKTASVTANFVPIIQCCGFMWLPKRVSSDLSPPSTWTDPKLEAAQIPWACPFIHFINLIRTCLLNFPALKVESGDPVVWGWSSISGLMASPAAGFPVHWESFMENSLVSRQKRECNR